MPTIKSLANKMKYSAVGKTRTEPLWKGPEVDGITQSMLSRWLVCRERFRLATVEGLRPVELFDKTIEYGHMWHCCEEALAAGRPWQDDLRRHCQALIQEHKLYPATVQEIDKWYTVCKLQFPIYIDFWKKDKQVKARKPISQEDVFDVLYKLPSGRVVRLRGKYDSVDLINKQVWLQENKTKSEINELKLRRQVAFDLQTMLYLTTLKHRLNHTEYKNYPIAGTRYNVIKRPLSGGAGTIRQHKPTKKNPQGESLQDYYKRLNDILRGDPQDYYLRLEIQVTPEDIKRFEDKFLKPCLESLCQWYETVTGAKPEYPHREQHWVHPFGIYNVLNEGGFTDLDDYLVTGNEVGLTRINTLFRELNPST